MTTTPDIDIYGVGLITISVCVPRLTPAEEIETFVNDEHPTGIRSRWKIAEEPTFHDGSPMPGICDHDDSRMHWLLTC